MTREEVTNHISLLTAASYEPLLSAEEVSGLVDFCEVTTESGETSYRVNKAVRKGWLIKAGKASGNYAFSDNGLSLHREQVIDNCLKMANKYASVDSVQITNNYNTEKIIDESDYLVNA